MVGSGDLGVEIDVAQLSIDIEDGITEYDPSNYHGLYVRFAEDGPLVTVYRTGKYIIIGCSTQESLEATREKFLQALATLDVLESAEDEGFDLQNVVCTASLEQDIDLLTLSIALGFESTEYKPEQFPGLVYRPQSHPSVILVFSNGKVVITGSSDIGVATDAFDHLHSRLNTYCEAMG